MKRLAKICGPILSILLLGVAWPADSLKFDFSPPPRGEKRATVAQSAIECPRCTAPPVIDGRLDDEAWKQAIVLRRMAGRTPPTTGRFCYDDKAVYIAVECSNPDGVTTSAQERVRDGRAWGDDCIEIFFKPNPDDIVSYQFVVNAAGSIYDGINRGASGSAKYDPEWRYASQPGLRRWGIEVAIPLEALKLTDWNRRLGFNIGRNGPSLRPMSWAGSYGDASAGALILEGAPERQASKREDEDRLSQDRSLAIVGNSLRVTADRFAAEPGERWIELKLGVRPSGMPLEKTRIIARMYAIGGVEPVAEVSQTPDRSSGSLLVDLRRHDLSKARLTVELTEGKARTGAATVLVSARACEEPLKPGERIAILLDVPKGVDPVENWPVTFGVPFPEGAMWNADELRLVDKTGKEIPCQKDVTGLWAREGAVKWVRFDAAIDSSAGCYVECAAAAVSPPQPVKLASEDGRIIVNTGPAQYVLSKGPSPIREVSMGGRRIATSEGGRGLYVVDQKGRRGTASSEEETVVVEARGPVAACVRFEGPYRDAQGNTMARHVTRVELVSGQPFARITHSLIITEDTNEVWFKDVGWELNVLPGAEPAAIFGVSRDAWRKSFAKGFGKQVESLHMTQDSHFRFLGGENRFSINASAAGGRAEETLYEGKECGDWAALSGRDGGFVMSCREAARQHPKDFEVGRNRLTLHLFSDRAGEELDFRTPALFKKWNLEKWFPEYASRNYKEKFKGDVFERIKGLPSNAVGWAKTHQLLFSPLGPDRPAETAARYSGLRTFPVYAHTDPRWVYRSEAMGPIYPKDMERFPHVEQYLDAVFKYWDSRIPEFGEYGFIDYFAGPHLAYRGKAPILKRYAFTYGLRPYLWIVYARSAGREERELAENTNRVFMDTYMARWDGPNKTKGLYVVGENTDSPYSHTSGCLPLYWQGAGRSNVSSSTNLDMFLWYYHLTGYRRAKDCVLEYAEAMKRTWKEEDARRNWRGLMLFRTLTQCYTLTWDPELKWLALKTAETWMDPEGDLLLSKDRPYNSTSYKTQVDVVGLIEGARVFGGRIEEIAKRVSRFWWERNVGAEVVGYNNPSGLIGNYLYEETPDPIVALDLLLKLRRVATGLDPQSGLPKPHYGTGSHNLTYVFRGIPYSEDVVVRAGADKEMPGAWAGYDDFGYPASVAFLKPDRSAVTARVRTPRENKPGELGSQLKLKVLGQSRPFGLDVNRMSETSSGAAKVRVPKDAPAGTYVVEPGGSGENLVLIDARTPLVLHAPGYWRPAPELMPAPRVYFQIPEDSRKPQIFFEGTARLLQPDGKGFREAEELHGWIDLPEDRPGLWSFVPVVNRLVRARNLPPFFAMDNPQRYFAPAIEWERAAPVEPEPPVPEETVFVPGVMREPEDQALHLVGKRQLVLEAGPKHASGDGGQYLAYSQGTIEFYLKPYWSSFDLAGPKRVWLPFVRMLTKRDPWTLQHCFDEEKGPGYYSHSLYGVCYSDGARHRVTLRTWRLNMIFERGEWVHIAWVWGHRKGIYASWMTDKSRVLTMQVYVNGKLGKQQSYRHADNDVADEPLKLIMEGRLNGAVDELRISDIQRYTKDFEPPSRDRPFRLDEHTRALFHFNGNVKCQSYGAEGEAPIKLKP